MNNEIRIYLITLNMDNNYGLINIYILAPEIHNSYIISLNHL